MRNSKSGTFLHSPCSLISTCIKTEIHRRKVFRKIATEHLPQLEHDHHFSSITVEHLQVHVLTRGPELGACGVDDALLWDSKILLVTSPGRSVVQASHIRKLMGLCSVQTSHVHPEMTGAGATAGAGVGVVIAEADDEEDEPRGGNVFGFFAGCSATRRLTGRSLGFLMGGGFDCVGIGGASVLSGFLELTFPPPLPVGFAGVGEI